MSEFLQVLVIMITAKKALACSSRVSLGSLMSLSQPGSHEEISLVTNLARFVRHLWRDALHAVYIG